MLIRDELARLAADRDTRTGRERPPRRWQVQAPAPRTRQLTFDFEGQRADTDTDDRGRA